MKYMILNIKYIKVFTLLLLIIIPFNVYASDKIEVKLVKCIDGDTARLMIDGKEEKVRFLAIDTPETKHPTKGVEPYGLQASKYTCNKLTNAKKIEIEYDENSDKQDRYNRQLVWVFTDDKLLQNELVKKGYAKVTYLYGDYKYTDILLKSEELAKQNKRGIYSLNTNTKTVVKSKNTEYDYKKEIKKYLKKVFANILEEIFE